MGEHGILTDEFIDLVAAETYLLIQAEQNDTEIKRLENLIAENQKAINNLMQALMLGKIADTQRPDRHVHLQGDTVRR